MKTKHLFLLFFLGFFTVMLTAPQKQKRSSSKRARPSAKRGLRARGNKKSAPNKRGSGGRQQGGHSSGGGSSAKAAIAPIPLVISTSTGPLQPLTSDRIKSSTIVLSKEDLETLKNAQALLDAKNKALAKDKKDLEAIKKEIETKINKKKKIIKTV